jgi:hypothetical protein
VGDSPKAELVIDPQALSGFDADADDFPVASGQFLCHTVTILSPLTGGVYFAGWSRSRFFQLGKIPLCVDTSLSVFYYYMSSNLLDF